MAVSIGTRDRSKMQFGAGEIYVADGGTVTIGSSFGDEITQTALTTLLSSFSYLGTLLQNPNYQTDPQTVSQIYSADPEIVHEVQHQSRITAEFGVTEMDNTMVNVMIARAEAGTLTDFMFIRTQDEGDIVNFIRNVPFTVALDKSHTWEDVEKLTINVDVVTTQLKKIVGQKLINNTPS